MHAAARAGKLNAVMGGANSNPGRKGRRNSVFMDARMGADIGVPVLDPVTRRASYAPRPRPRANNLVPRARSGWDTRHSRPAALLESTVPRICRPPVYDAPPTRRRGLPPLQTYPEPRRRRKKTATFAPSYCWDQRHHVSVSSMNKQLHKTHRNFFDRPVTFVDGNPLSPSATAAHDCLPSAPLDYQGAVTPYVQSSEYVVMRCSRPWKSQSTQVAQGYFFDTIEGASLGFKELAGKEETVLLVRLNDGCELVVDLGVEREINPEDERLPVSEFSDSEYMLHWLKDFMLTQAFPDKLEDYW